MLAAQIGPAPDVVTDSIGHVELDCGHLGRAAVSGCRTHRPTVAATGVVETPAPRSACPRREVSVNDRTRAGPALRKLAPLTRVFHRVALILLREDVGGQGPHLDPEDSSTDPPVAARWTTAHRRAVRSPNMTAFRDALQPPGGGATERDGVLGDLARYYDLTSDEALRRCLNWEDTSIEEWDSAAGLSAFYDTVTSWSFDLLWYCYLQSRGYGYPESVILADRLSSPPRWARMLDLGSGTGVTAQLFTALGWDVTLADVSRPLLDFARWRLELRQVTATYLHLPAQLPTHHYDLVTAFDVMAHVPPEDLDATAQRLHRALRPGGLLVANYDVRRRSRANAWHLYDDDLPLRWAIQRAGFAPVRLIDGILWIYQATPTDGLRWRTRTALGWLHLASPPARALRQARRAAARAALAAFYRSVGVRRRDDQPGRDRGRGRRAR